VTTAWANSITFLKIGPQGVRKDLQFCCQFYNAGKIEKYQFIMQERWKNITQNVV
jgi:hypothetical protein